MCIRDRFTGGGIQWSLLPGSAGGAAAGAGVGAGAPMGTLYTSNFMPGLTFKLDQLPSLPAGVYTLSAQGMNLAGALSPPASLTFSLMASDLSSVRVYPNPWRVDQHAAYPLKFDQMPPGSQVKIFTVSAHWVQTLTADNTGTATWLDLRNSDGEKVQSGLYLYLVTDSHGGKARGKFSIIR